MKKMKKILIFGKNGQLATDLIEILKDKEGYSIDVISSKDIDFSETNRFKDFVNKLPRYDIAINASAYNLVDKAEEESEKALKINRDAVRVMADFCKKNEAIFIHFSTNYVFDGKNPRVNKEDDVDFIKPLGQYAKSKLDGEIEIRKSGCKYLIFRVATVFREGKSNFVTKMIELFNKIETLKIVDDQISNPCYSFDLANATVKIIDEKVNERNLNQIYHLCNEGEASYFDLCKFIHDKIKDDERFEVITKKILPITSSEYPTPAKRPLNGALDNNKFKETFDFNLPKWQDGVERAISKI